MADAATTDGGIGVILASGDRDFLVRNSSEQVKISSIEASTVAFYFSASWCPPCRQFTPKLIEAYKELTSQGKSFEVVFVSADRDEEAFNAYFAKMPWLAVPFSDSQGREGLDSRFKVRGIPHLVILNAKTGEVYTRDGVVFVSDYGVEAYPFTPERINELKEQEKAAKDNQTIHSVLGTPTRDYLISNKGDKVPIFELEGKYVGLCFVVNGYGPITEFTTVLAKIYDKLQEVGEKFEVVAVSLDKDESSFNESFTNMPWLAIPQGDKLCKKLVRYFELRDLPTLVLIGPDGKTLNNNVADIIDEHGLEAWEGFPFNAEKMEILVERAKAAKDNQTIHSVLGTPTRDYLISNKGDKVPISELEGKYVGLCFVVNGYGPVDEFTAVLAKIYEKLKEVGEKFEVVAVSLDNDESSFNESFANMPWLAIPQGDKLCGKLVRYFELRDLPTLVLIDPDGKTLNNNVADIIDEHGLEAWEGFPFNAEKMEILAERAKAKAASQTLVSLLVRGDLDFVIGKDGAKVPVSELVGKTVLLYFSAKWCGPCRAFLPTLVKEYNKIKEKNSDFEIVFISSDKDQSSFDDFFSEMPWLALPLGDERKASLTKTFKIRGIPSLVAISPTGQTVTKDAKSQLMIHGADAFPFTEERLEELEKKIDEMTKEWPEKLKHELHDEHELVLILRRMYRCDGCKEMGCRWSYRCDECDFDLHPKCALGEKKKGEEEKATEEAPTGYVCEGGVCTKA